MNTDNNTQQQQQLQSSGEIKRTTSIVASVSTVEQAVTKIDPNVSYIF
jgi:hypothetical protein